MRMTVSAASMDLHCLLVSFKVSALAVGTWLYSDMYSRRRNSNCSGFYSRQYFVFWS